MIEQADGSVLQSDACKPCGTQQSLGSSSKFTGLDFTGGNPAYNKPFSLFERKSYPEEDDFYLRENSFNSQNWPKIFDYCGKSAETMALAGFYKINHPRIADAVECFYCHQIIGNFSIDDNPYVCHLRFSKNCAFILTKKDTRPDLFQAVKIKGV